MNRRVIFNDFYEEASIFISPLEYFISIGEGNNGKTPMQARLRYSWLCDTLRIRTGQIVEREVDSR